MEGNCSQGCIVRGENAHGRFDSQVGSSMRDLRPNAMHQNQNQHHPNPRNDSGFDITMDAHRNNVDRGKKSMSEDDELCLSCDGQNKSNKNSPWQRVKWMDKMVKLMITALSYIGEDSSTSEDGCGRKFAVLQKKGKWRSVSKVMDERGYRVSPQQCEDKFNDLNKRYKKLNEMLGRGTSCEVVENPALLDKIDYLNEKEKEEVRKIMSSKHLFYEEMCSYHNGNRLHLPHDPAVQRSLHLITLGSRDDHDNDDHGNHQNEDLDDEDDHDGVLSDRPLKRCRQSQSHEDPNKGYDVPLLPRSQADVSRGMSLDSEKAAGLQRQRIESKSLELEERKLQIQAELMELERQQFRWEVFSKKRDQKLEKMRMENERMKLENERMTLELKRIELGAKL
ncbi:unnamed protein product [Arabidopsis arenosa]|uniref:Myb/SANT-like DNA-binding domain-containing protein n=1 Tax=Arabidopsis arenosa TaxID=38785 RepID=A0A8S1ZZA1_ARAAE|nr:unnamed protein product [Arabidopsis arenosa]